MLDFFFGNLFRCFLRICFPSKFIQKNKIKFWPINPSNNWVTWLVKHKKNYVARPTGIHLKWDMKAPNLAIRSGLKISIIIITKNRTKMLDRCLRSVMVAAAAANRTQYFAHEILVGFNGDPENRVNFESNPQFGDAIQFSSWSESLTLAAARNHLLKIATGEWLFFLDDDAAVPEDYFVHSLKCIGSSDKNIGVLGGPNLNFLDCNESETIQGIVLGSWWSAGPFADRYRIGKRHQTRFTHSLILCNLWLHKASVGEVLFDSQMEGGEENEIFTRLQKFKKLKYQYFPELFVYHQRREDLSKFKDQAYKFGHGRGQWLQKYFPGSVFLLPLLWVLLNAIKLISPLVNLLSALLIKSEFKIKPKIWVYATLLHWGYFDGIVNSYSISLREKLAEQNQQGHHDAVV